MLNPLQRSMLLGLPSPLRELVQLADYLGPGVLGAIVRGLRALKAGNYDDARRELEEAARVRAFDELQKRKHG